MRTVANETSPRGSADSQDTKSKVETTPTPTATPTVSLSALGGCKMQLGYSDYLRVKFKPGKISATNHADTKAMLRLNIWATKFVFMVLV